MGYKKRYKPKTERRKEQLKDRREIKRQRNRVYSKNVGTQIYKDGHKLLMKLVNAYKKKYNTQRIFG